MAAAVPRPHRLPASWADIGYFSDSGFKFALDLRDVLDSDRFRQVLAVLHKRQPNTLDLVIQVHRQRTEYRHGSLVGAYQGEGPLIVGLTQREEVGLGGESEARVPLLDACAGGGGVVVGVAADVLAQRPYRVANFPADVAIGNEGRGCACTPPFFEDSSRGTQHHRGLRSGDADGR